MAFLPVEARVNQILPGVQKVFTDAYLVQGMDKVQSYLSGLMDFGLKATARKEKLAYPEAPPAVKRWDYGTTVQHGAFNYRQWEFDVLRWGLAIDWNVDDDADDQLGALEKQAMNIAERYKYIPWQIAMQILAGGTASANLLPGPLLAPDGVGLFATTNGEGGPRFGRVGGNIVTGSGVASEAALEKDVFAVQNAFAVFLDQAGQFRWRSWQTSTSLHLFVPFALREVFLKAFKRKGLSLANVNGVTTAAAVAQITDEYVSQIVFAQELTGSDWFAVLSGAPTVATPMLCAPRDDATLYPVYPQTSGPQAETDSVTLFSKARWGFALGPCDAVIRVNNS